MISEYSSPVHHTIRLATEHDVPAITALMQEGFAQAYPATNPLSHEEDFRDAMFYDQLQQVVKNKITDTRYSSFFVADTTDDGKEGEIIATCASTIALNYRSAEITNVQVAAGFRGHKIAKRMVAAAMDDIHSKGVKKVELHTLADSVASQRLYQGLGFVIASEGAFEDASPRWSVGMGTAQYVRMVQTIGNHIISDEVSTPEPNKKLSDAAIAEAAYQQDMAEWDAIRARANNRLPRT